MAIIYHLTTKAAWAAAQAAGEYEAPSLVEEGFIHCSKDIEQMLRVAERLYAGRTGLMALEVDVEKLESPLKVEPSWSGELYPHIYGKLNLEAVVAERQLVLGADGKHRL